MGQQLQTRSIYSKPGHMVALSNWDVDLSVLPMSSVAPKWTQKYIETYIQLSATSFFKELTKIHTRNGTAFGES